MAASTSLQAYLSGRHALLQGMLGHMTVMVVAACGGGSTWLLFGACEACSVCVCVCLSACCEVLVMVVGPLVMLLALLYQCIHPFMLWS